MTVAKELGIYLIIRPGPYVNAETNAGGFPLWATTGAYGSLRNDDERYTAAWTPFWSEISKIIKPHLITNGGNVIMFQVRDHPQELTKAHLLSGNTDRERAQRTMEGHSQESLEPAHRQLYAASPGQCP